jgi:hypothetical protein
MDQQGEARRDFRRTYRVDRQGAAAGEQCARNRAHAAAATTEARPKLSLMLVKDQVR